MPLYTYNGGVVIDAVTGKGVAAKVGAATDFVTGDPVATYNLNDDVIPTVLATNRDGYYPSFRSTSDRVMVRFGSVTLALDSIDLYRTLKDEAVAARQAAEAAVSGAGVPTAQAVDARIDSGASPAVRKGDLVYNVLDHGVVGNGIADDTAAMQALIDNPAVSRIYIPACTVLVNPDTRIHLKSDLTIEMHKKAVVKAKTSAADAYFIFRMQDCTNVSIIGDGSKIVGERTTHTGTTGESGMGIGIYGSTNVTISGLNISDCWGDGIYIGKTVANVQCKNVRISNVTVDNVRRNGISVISVDGLYLRDTILQNVSGIPPQAGIDFEVNYADEWITNVVMDNVKVKNVAGYGIMFAYGALTNDHPDLNLTVNNCSVDTAQRGLTFGMPNTNTPDGKVIVTNFRSSNTRENGISVERWHAKLPKLELIRPTLEKFNTSGLTSNAAMGISIRNSSGDTWNTLGNILIDHPILKAPAGFTQFGVLVLAGNGTPSDIIVDSPRFIGFNYNNKANFGTGVTVHDRYREIAYTVPDAASTTVTNARWLTNVYTPSWTAMRTIVLGADIVEGKEVTITCDNSFGVKVTLSAPCLPYLAAAGSIETRQRGASITLYRASSGWVPRSVVGTWYDSSARPLVAGSRGGNAALTDLLTRLAALGIITDSTTT